MTKTTVAATAGLKEPTAGLKRSAQARTGAAWQKVADRADLGGRPAWGLMAAIAGAGLVGSRLPGYWPYIAAWSMAYGIAVISLKPIAGDAGILSLAQGALMGIGAYATSLYVTRGGLPFPVALALAVLTTVPFAVLLALPSFRVRGLSLAVVTLGFQSVCENLVFKWKWLVGTGFAGQTIAPIERPKILGVDFANDRNYVLLVTVVLLVVVYVLSNLGQRRFGRAFASIRDAEVAAESLGISVIHTKLAAFIVGGAVAGLAGGLLGTLTEGVSPITFTLGTSLVVFALAIIGGARSLGGLWVAGALYVIGPELARPLKDVRGGIEMVVAAGAVAAILLLPGGLGALGARIGGRIRNVWESR